MAKKRKAPEVFREPDTSRINSDVELVNIYQDYRENFPYEKSQAWARKYAKKNNLPTNFKYVPDNIGWLCRLIELGYEPTEKQIERIENSILNANTTEPEKDSKLDDSKPKKKIKTPHELLEEKLAPIYGDIDVYIDKLFNDENPEFDIYSYLRKNDVNGMSCSKIVNYIQDSVLNDLELYFDNDEDMQEAYSFLTKTKVKEIYKNLLQLIDETEKWKNVKKKDRKPKKVKAKTKRNKTKKVKYKEYDDELGIKSEFPENIIGAKEVWLYNTKTRKLTVLKNLSGNLNINGTTVRDYEDESSYYCKLRKPAEQIPVILSKKKREVNNLEKQLKKNSKKLNGRINNDTIILKVV